MNKNRIIALMSITLTSCHMADIAIQQGFYEKWHERTQMIKNDSLGIFFTYDHPEETILYDSAVHLNSSLTKYGKEILKEVGFNRKTDTLYFSTTWMYCFQLEQLDERKFLHEILGDMISGREKGDSPTKTPHISERILVNEQDKRIISQHVFPFRNKYLSFVYVQQSKTKKNKPWSYTFDVTDNNYVFFRDKAIRKYIGYSRKNSLLFLKDMY